MTRHERLILRDCNCRIYLCGMKATKVAVCISGSSLVENEPSYIVVCQDHFKRISTVVTEHLLLDGNVTGGSLSFDHVWAEVPLGMDISKGRLV